MLELYGIKKDYPTGGGKVEALKGIDIKFREKEFVAILGPSGCGKTTLLNIIGGLDHYTEGDLVIDGRSTKQYSDRDWDTYRNHTIGFVFQNYYLIPHQSVLRNVELALTLSGVSKPERKKAAVQALEDVGLGDQIKKKPAQLSGGQAQRVAIARALINDPGIVLADEPTGALDTETSVQIMEMLKKASEDHLVIMVTHNPDLAEKYATRIVKMLDGRIIDDSAPLQEVSEEPAAEVREGNAEEVSRAEEGGQKKGKRKKKPSMSLPTAIMLSLNNLFTKKGRTILTAFAGSIGIIGIALIYSVSAGTNRFIDRVQEETLASYPITIERSHIDLNELLLNIAGNRDNDHDHENDAVYQRISMYNMVNSINNTSVIENDLKSFRQYLIEQTKDSGSKYGGSITGLSYTYSMDILAYTKNVKGEIVASDTTELTTRILTKIFGSGAASRTEVSSGSSGSAMMSLLSSSSSSSSSSMWQEMLSGINGETVGATVKSQYDVVYGEWPTAYNQVILVLDSNNEISDIALYALGLRTQDEIDAIIDKAMSGEELDVPDEKWSYEEICGRELKIIVNSDCFVKDEITGKYNDLRATDAGLRYLYNNGIDIEICGIVKAKKDAISPMLRGGTLGYTYKLTEYIIEKTASSAAARAQKSDTGTDIFTGLPFKSNVNLLDDAAKAELFKNYAKGLNTSGKAEAFMRIVTSPSEELISNSVGEMLSSLTREKMIELIVSGAAGQGYITEDELREYIKDMSDEDLKELVTSMVVEQFRTQFAQKAKEQFKNMTDEELAAMFDQNIAELNDEQYAALYSSALEFSESTYEENLTKLGSVDIDDPETISIYTSTFPDKDNIKAMIDEYNEGKDEFSAIAYTDFVGILMSSVTTIVNSISYVLISFVAISLVVSSIMIGVITLISVQERTKEIGILRALGASKKNVSTMFIAETVIIGFVSGVFGVALSWVLTLPINAIVHALSGMKSLSAYLPFNTAIILIFVSMLLTLVAGLIPSGSAARKDPVVALRTE
ncbi:MAG: ABC transporter ATP-binding protein/permease [Clostridia bacterium]|nr:ABC transporter ATP-binding protein/permease [Clostridia bacterium]